MRILLIGSHKTWRMERGLQRAFRRAGHEARLIDDRRARRLMGRRLTQHWALAHARRFRPDFVFLSKCLGLELETVEWIVRGRPNAMWYMDPQWHRDVDRPDVGHIAGVGRLAATFFVSGFETEWRAHGLNAKFLPAAGDREITPAPPDPRFAADVAFIGRGYDRERARFLVEVARHARLRVWGLGWEEWRDALGWGGRAVEGRAFAKACSSAAVVLGIHPQRAAGATTYASNRMWITCLAGGFYLGERTPGIDRMLLDGVHCAWYTDLASCLAAIRHYLAHADERERVRAAGEAFVREHHTFDSRARHILSGEPWANPL